MLTRSEAHQILDEAQFRAFTPSDYQSWAGCESKFPLICDDRSDYLIIMDGGTFSFYPVYDESMGSDFDGSEFYVFEIS